jgi:DNA-binding XRE family transcriptional regulator
MAERSDSQDWRARLRQARRRLELTQDGLAQKAGVSKDTVRAYETGRRFPEDRDHLVRVLEAVELSRLESNTILEELGFAPIRDLGIPADHATWSGLIDAQRLVDECPWPSFAVNDLVEVVVGNAALQALFGVDFSREYMDPPSRSLLALASTPRFADHIENWDEAVGILVAVWKGHFTRAVSLDDPTPHLSKILDSVAGGDTAYLLRVLKIWEDIELIPPVRRWFYPIVWRDEELGLLRFQGMVHTGDDPETMISFNDWVPSDADSWSKLDAIKARHRKRRR